MARSLRRRAAGESIPPRVPPDFEVQWLTCPAALFLLKLRKQIGEGKLHDLSGMPDMRFWFILKKNLAEAGESPCPESALR